MSRKVSPVWMLSIVVVLALASVGVVYGIWQQTLFINATVYTGEAEAEFAISEVYTEGDIKNVASCVADVIETNDEYDTIVITATNMFPGVACDVVFDVTSVGSVPIHIHQPVFTGYDTTAILVELSDCYTQDFQLHQNESAECEIDIDVLQSAPNDDDLSYSFTGTVLVHQYNQEP